MVAGRGITVDRFAGGRHRCFGPGDSADARPGGFQRHRRIPREAIERWLLQLLLVRGERFDLEYDEREEAAVTRARELRARQRRAEARREGQSVPELATHGMHATTRGCLAGSGVCFISHEGGVYPCGYLPISAGDLRKERFHDIWENAEVFAALRDPNSRNAPRSRRESSPAVSEPDPVTCPRDGNDGTGIWESART